MFRPNFQKFLILSGIILGVYLGIRYFLPLALPFLLGAGLAAAAEPLVSFCEKRLRIPRGGAAGLGVSATLLLTAAAVVLLAALLVRELTVLAGVVPDLEQTVRDGLSLLEQWLLGLVNRTPEGIRGILSRSLTGLFSDSTGFVDRAGRWALNLASAVLVRLPDSALGLGTCILASYMISAQLPRLRRLLREKIPHAWRERYLPVLSRMKRAVLGWLRAQLRLAGVTFVLVLAGFLLLRISYAPLWALITALVDAVPLLGTGTLLIPWSLVCLLQGDHIRCVALLGIYAAAAVTRSVLEPRLVGKQLGLNPLFTLAMLYLGFRLWGIGGMILSPVLAVAAVQAAGLEAVDN